MADFRRRIKSRISRRPEGVSPLIPLAAFGAGLVIAGAMGAKAYDRWRERLPADSAPGRTRRGVGRFGEYAVVGRTVTIGRPRAELYSYWRDFRNLSRFMENIEKVEVDGDRTIWAVAAPAGRSVTLVTEIVEERENELIAWRSLPESDIDTEGRVTFRDAPTGRGTCVEAIVAYKPPGGQLGRLVAKLFQREPNIQGRRELKRFKMLMETGELATAANRRNR